MLDTYEHPGGIDLKALLKCRGIDFECDFGWASDSSSIPSRKRHGQGLRPLTDRGHSHCIVDSTKL